MKNSEYWKKRFEQLENSIHNKSIKAIEELHPVFDDTLKEIDQNIAIWYQRIANNNEVSLNDAKKLLKDNELKEFKWNVKEYIKYGQENAINQKWMKELENASAKYHISKLEAQKIEIRQKIEELFDKEQSIVNSTIKSSYEDTYYHSCFEMEKGFNIGMPITKLDNKAIDKIIVKPWTADGKNFSDRIWSSKGQLIDELHKELTRMYTLGDAPDRAIKNISKKFDVSKSQAGRLVQTEQAYFSSVAQKEAFSELDVEKYEIVATLDNKTSKICQDMDGHVFDMKDYEAGVTANPFHPNCRTTTVPYFDDEFSIGERAAKDENGKTYYVPANMKYSEWKQKFVVDGSRTDLQSTKIGNVLSLEEESALNKYISSDSYKINDLLRRKLELPEQYEKMKNNLDSALSKLKPYEGSAIRVLDITDKDLLEEFIKRNKIDEIIEFSEYLSFSDKNDYNNDGNVFIYIKSKKAKDIRKFNPEEREILYPRNSQFVVKDVYEHNGKYHILWSDENE